MIYVTILHLIHIAGRKFLKKMTENIYKTVSNSIIHIDASKSTSLSNKIWSCDFDATDTNTFNWPDACIQPLFATMERGLCVIT